MRKVLIILSIALIAACGPKKTVTSFTIDPSRIYQDYSVSTGRNTDTVVAFFRDGGPDGKAIELYWSAEVKHNGRVLKRDRRPYSDTAAYTAYLQEFYGDNEFEFTAPGGQKYINRVSVEPVELKSGRLELDRKRDIVIELTRPVKDSEQMSTEIALTARDAADDSGAKGFVRLKNNFAGNRASIVIHPEDLADMGWGMGVIAVKVEGEKPLDEGTPNGGRMVYDFTTGQIQARIWKK
jgi:hypothetical protein